MARKAIFLSSIGNVFLKLISRLCDKPWNYLIGDYFIGVTGRECVIKNYISVIKQMNLKQNKAEKLTTKVFRNRLFNQFSI